MLIWTFLSIKFIILNNSFLSHVNSKAIYFYFLEILSLFIILLWNYLILKFDDYIRLNIKITVVQNLKNHGCCFYYLKFNPNASEPFQKLNRMSRPPWNGVYFQVWPLQGGNKRLARPVMNLTSRLNLCRSEIKDSPALKRRLFPSLTFARRK